MKLIVALDYNNISSVKSLVGLLGGGVSYYKVGLELFVSCGYAALDYLKSEGKQVFLDLKFHDIPNTASGAVSAACEFGVDMVNIHTQGGEEMMRACAEACEAFAKKGGTKPTLLGVTLLTSLGEEYLRNYSIGFEKPSDYVSRLATLAKSCGLDGVVSSAKETKIIKDLLGKDFITVTPGIRPLGASVGDQKRVVTVQDAREIGTDYIVVGRPITAAKDPLEAAEEIIKEL